MRSQEKAPSRRAAGGFGVGGLVLEAEATEGLDALQRSRAVDLEQVALTKAFDAPVGDVRKTGEAIGGMGARLFAKARKARDTGLFAVDGALGPWGDVDASPFLLSFLSPPGRPPWPWS